MTPDQTASQIAEAVAKSLESSGGGTAWIAGVAITVFGSLAALWIIKVAIPESNNRAKHTEVLAVQGQTIAGIAKEVIDAGKVSEHTLRTLMLMLSMNRVELKAFEKISEQAKIDLTSEIGELRGILSNTHTTRD